MSEEIPKKSLLLVEDDLELRAALGEFAGSFSDQVFLAANGVEALELVRANPQLCAIVSDIHMPKMTGLELLSKLREDFNPVPFVILTDFGDKENFREAVRLHATDFLAKPFDPKGFQLVLETALEYGQELQKLEKTLDLLFRHAGGDPKEIEKKKRARRTVHAMPIESAVYLKKRNKAG